MEPNPFTTIGSKPATLCIKYKPILRISLKTRSFTPNSAMVSSKPRAIFMAFGTNGDVLPIAAIAAAFASDRLEYEVVLITHSAHQELLEGNLAGKGVVFVAISTPPVVAFRQDSMDSDSELWSFSSSKKSIKMHHRQECLSAVERIFGDGSSIAGDFIVINFFALEGWSLAELYQVQCIVAAPYVVPYSAPSSFERQFKKEFPLLYKYFRDAPADKLSWKDVLHWMWPLFSEDWGSWRSDCLNLSPLPFMDPVTNLPTWHIQAQAPLLLYGFSKEIVECPGYWPTNIHVCGFWSLPVDWQVSCGRCKEIFSMLSHKDSVQKTLLCFEHTDLQDFLVTESSSCLPIFVGLNSIGSMGFLRNPWAFLMVLRAALETTNYRFVLFTAGYEPLNVAIQMTAGDSSTSKVEKSGTLLFSSRLFLLFWVNITIPYSWLFPRCEVVIHHGGSGSTAAALHAGTPQVVCPFLLDQFYWAERLCWLGVAPPPLQKHHLVPDTEDSIIIKRAAEVLSITVKRALSPEIKAQAAKIAERISSEDGVGEAVKILKENVMCSIEEKPCSLQE